MWVKEESRMTVGFLARMTGTVVGPAVEMENTGTGEGLGDDNESYFMKGEFGCLRDT